MNKIRIDELPWEEQRSPAGKFHSFYRNISVALGGIRNAGTWGGGHPFDLQLRRIPPGASVCPFHSHLGQWELFVVRSGDGTVRAGDETHPVKSGDVFVHPPGEPHQITNSGTADLEVFIVADNPPLDACYYPDSDKWALRPPGKVFRLAEVGYFDGEEAPVAGAPPYRPSAVPPLPPAPPFAQRKRHPDDLPWETWQSPKGKYRESFKDLSGALGDVLNGWPRSGHPFNLTLSRVPPGHAVCPFHIHSTQWELFIILGGTATVRAGAETGSVQAGEVVLHPPGEPHQIINTGTAELEFYLIADNPPVDYWHYPDSGKWGLREPRKFFRMTETDYYDGEE
ncbi:MAG: cupin domain-containing protein [Opitutaceae bacterium]|nr:cupin domain-containing protein [Opitutaceae bacterium]